MGFQIAFANHRHAGKQVVQSIAMGTVMGTAELWPPAEPIGAKQLAAIGLQCIPLRPVRCHEPISYASIADVARLIGKHRTTPSDIARAIMSAVFDL